MISTTSLPQEFNGDNQVQLKIFLKLMILKIMDKHGLDIDQKSLDDFVEKTANTMLANAKDSDQEIKLEYLLKPEFIMRLTMTTTTMCVLNEEKESGKDLDGRLKNPELAKKLEKFFEQNMNLTPDAFKTKVENTFTPDELLKMKPLFNKMMEKTFPDNVPKPQANSPKDESEESKILFSVLADNTQTDAEKGVLLCFVGNPNSPNPMPSSSNAASPTSAINAICDALFTPIGINTNTLSNIQTFADISDEMPPAYSNPTPKYSQ